MGGDRQQVVSRGLPAASTLLTKKDEERRNTRLRLGGAVAGLVCLAQSEHGCLPTPLLLRFLIPCCRLLRLRLTADYVEQHREGSSARYRPLQMRRCLAFSSLSGTMDSDIRVFIDVVLNIFACGMPLGGTAPTPSELAA